MTTEEKIKVMQAWLDGKVIQIKSVASDEVWHDVEKEPSWDWLVREYRIKPKEKTSTPITEEELKRINSRIWIKYKDDDEMFFVNKLYVDTEKRLIYRLNPDTKCWEEWSDK